MTAEHDADMWVTDAVSSGPETGAVVSATMIEAGRLTDEHVGKYLGFHDDRTQLNIPGEIKRIEHHDGPPPSVSIWLRYPEQVVERVGLGKRDDYMRVAPWFQVQLVETITF
ncbi:hypothetical protein MycrhN_2557 [Mycolicibacterium rhodesiae NBB3]|uniref:Uncharacterized protein n=1 Tax=Mycolicibacterium rhodesiae (strain NBB3) TaxID=710685 RepID=G8RX94_MYCRN|nr:hypothetical protein [Mycolicibacterium rhodesiae]AEV73142.1 hypothetical protein MycrhN_2557 [Mycolicibacterium rhodesiae NBB3]